MKELLELLEKCEKSDLKFFKARYANAEIEFSKVTTNSGEILSDIEHENEQSKPDKIVEENNFYVIKSQYVGIIHLEEKFLDTNSNIEISQNEVIGSIEAMKLFNEIVSPIDGKLIEVLIRDGDQVEYNQELFKIQTNTL